MISSPLSLSQPAISHKPFCVLHSELSLLSCATPLHEITTTSPRLCRSPLTPSHLFPASVRPLLFVFTHTDTGGHNSVGWISEDNFIFVKSRSWVSPLPHRGLTNTDTRLRPTPFPPAEHMPYFPFVPPPAHTCNTLSLSLPRTHSPMLFGFIIIAKNTPPSRPVLQGASSLVHCKLLHVLLNCSLHESPRIRSSHS